MSGFREVARLGVVALGALGPTTIDEYDLQHRAIMSLMRGQCRRVLTPNLAGGFVIADCIDGRVMAGGQEAPRSAGATLGLAAAAVATGYADSLASVIEAFAARGVPIAAHWDCGANEALEHLSGTLLSHADSIDKIRAECGLQPSGPARQTWAERLATLARDQTPAGRLNHFDAACLAQPDGEHRSWLACLNWESGTTVDRVALRDQHGVQCLAIDAWALAGSARVVTSVLKVKARTAGRELVDFLLDLNLTAVHQLGNAQMKVLSNDAS